MRLPTGKETMQKVRRRFALCALLIAVTGPPIASPDQAPAPPPPHYRVVALPPGFDPVALNDRAQIAGTFTLDTKVVSRSAVGRDERRAALWEPSHHRRGGSLRLLPVVDAKENPLQGASGINRRGDVVGTIVNTGSGAISYSYSQVVIWPLRGKPRVLGNLPGLSAASPAGIDEWQQVIGTSGPASAMEAPSERPDKPAVTLPDGQRYIVWERVFRWQDGKMTDLGPGEANGFNGKGEIVGVLAGQATLWRGKERVLICPGAAMAINRRSQVIGTYRTSSLNPVDALIHPARAFLYERGQRYDLPLLAGCTESEAQAINEQGQVVGLCADHDRENVAACLWQSGRMFDLNRYIPLDSGWTLESADGINTRGEIVGAGTYRGENRACLLTPSR